MSSRASTTLAHVSYKLQELCMVPSRNSRGPAVEDLRDSGIYKKGSGERNVLSYDMGGTPSMCLCQPLKMASLSKRPLRVTCTLEARLDNTL